MGLFTYPQCSFHAKPPWGLSEHPQSSSERIVSDAYPYVNVVDVYMTGCSLPQDTEKLQESKVKETELSTNRMASASSQDLATNIDTVNSEASEKHVIEADIPWMMSNQNLYINEVAMQLEHQEGGTQELLQRDLQGSDNLFDNLDILDMKFDGAELPQLPARSNIDSSMMTNISTYSSDLWLM